MKAIDLTGQKFGRLKVLQRIPGCPTFYICECVCSNTKPILGRSLVTSKTQSCGCLRKETSAAHCRENHTTHGGRHTKTYSVWIGMKRRCDDSSREEYKNYGGRGIQVCREWYDFAVFLKDMGECPEGLTLDRKYVNGNYEPDNCRWATRYEQDHNKRNNVFKEAA